MTERNPLIAALFSASQPDLAGLITDLPPFDPRDRLLDQDERTDRLGALYRFRVPFEWHRDLKRRSDEAMQLGYSQRNPTDLEYETQLDQQLDALERGERGYGGAARSFSLRGESGMGKTFAIEAIGRTYPPWVVHDTANGERHFSATQIPLLYVNTPAIATPKQVSRDLIGALDTRLERMQYHLYPTKPPARPFAADYSGRSTVEDLSVGAANLLRRFHVGLVVLDEIQNLSPARSGGEDRVFQYILNLTNTLRVPILFVGTPHALDWLESTEYLERRLEGLPPVIVHPMRLGDDDWETLIDALFRYVYLRGPVDRNAVSEALWNVSLGKTDNAIVAFRDAQEVALERGVETLDPAGIYDAFAAKHPGRAARLRRVTGGSAPALLAPPQPLPKGDAPTAPSADDDPPPVRRARRRGRSQGGPSQGAQATAQQAGAPEAMDVDASRKDMMEDLAPDGPLSRPNRA